MLPHLKHLLFPALLVTAIAPAHGQKFLERAAEFFEFTTNQKALDAGTATYANKLVLAPIAAYEPNTSLGVGVGAKYLFKPQSASEQTRTSNIPVSVMYTLNNQFIFFSSYTVFFNDEAWLLKGNMIYSIFPQDYFGQGSLTTEEDARAITYNNFLFEPLLLRQIRPNWFVGGGIRYNTYRRVELFEAHNELPEGTSLQDELGSTSVGAEFAFTIDSRDNVLNAFSGTFLEFTHGVYGEILGGTHEFMLSKINFRQYHQPFENRPFDVVAIELYGRASWNGAPPLETSSLGGGELLRGFQEFRFRDRYAFFAQAEYRWQALERLGFVGFLGAGDVANNRDQLGFDRLKYSAGMGVRLKIVPSENLNIRFDYAFGLGTDSDRNFYLGIAEAF